MARIGSTELEVFPLCLGGNVFGWTADEGASCSVLDAYFAAGGNFVDTADVYSAWVPGNSGGESETILGRWMRARGNRDRMVVATKVGKAPWLPGLSAKTIHEAIDGSLARLQTDRVDLYYAHCDDEATPLDETLRAFDAVVRAGKVRYVAASNYRAPRLAEALAISRREGLARYVALQPSYNLMDRDDYEGALEQVCAREGVSCVPYYALAQGFLTGKYRPGVSVDTRRGEAARKHVGPRGDAVLAALDTIAEKHRTTVAAVALAWLVSRPPVASAIASARTLEQLEGLLPVATLQLGADDLARLDAASRPLSPESQRWAG